MADSDAGADHSADDTTVRVNAYGINTNGKTSLNTTYQDLVSNQSFDSSSSSWSYSHHSIQSLQDINL